MFQLMVVEDDKSTAKLMKAVLELSGYKVISASDGLDALKMMENHHIDLIVLDVMMPNMDGYEFTEHLRSVGDNTPILMVTAKHLPEELSKGFIAGTDDYLSLIHI